MNSYVVLLRGINVGGRNKLSMANLRNNLEKSGFTSVRTYIQSGNVLLRSSLGAKDVAETIEHMLTQEFKLDSKLIKTVAIERDVFRAVVSDAPKDFGVDHDSYRYDVIFLMNISSTEAMSHITAREGIDSVWQGESVVYFRRPSLSSPDATKSYLGKISQTPIYRLVTIRNWNTVSKLNSMMDQE